MKNQLNQNTVNTDAFMKSESDECRLENVWIQQMLQTKQVHAVKVHDAISHTPYQGDYIP